MLPLPTIKSLSSLIKALKPTIRDDYRAYADEPGLDDENIPSVQLTIGWNPEDGSWDYQTGDNSYSGAAYSYPYWGVVDLYRRSNSLDLARDIRSQLADL